MSIPFSGFLVTESVWLSYIFYRGFCLLTGNNRLFRAKIGVDLCRTPGWQMQVAALVCSCRCVCSAVSPACSKRILHACRNGAGAQLHQSPLVLTSGKRVFCIALQIICARGEYVSDSALFSLHSSEDLHTGPVSPALLIWAPFYVVVVLSFVAPWNRFTCCVVAPCRCWLRWRCQFSLSAALHGFISGFSLRRILAIGSTLKYFVSDKQLTKGC